jgi:integrase
VAQVGPPQVKRPQITFNTLANDWQMQVVPMYKHSTQKNHTHILGRHLVPRFGATQLGDLSRQHVQAYVADLVREGYAPKTIDHIHDVLSAVLRTAVKWGHLTDGLPPLAKTLVGFGLVTGLRRGELFALRWKDLGENDRTLSVREAVYEGRFDTPKTAAGLRRIPLAPPARALVAAWRARSKRTGPEDLIFSTWAGKPISPNNVLRAAVFPACEKLGFSRTTWLTFRRTYASWAHDLGMPGKVIAQLMGHAKVDTTLNVYAQVLGDSVRESAERVGSKLITIDHTASEVAATTHCDHPETQVTLFIPDT